MRMVDSDVLVECVKKQTRPLSPFVMSRQVRQWLTSNRIDWGAPHGWHIKSAELVEWARREPRIEKWKTGPYRNSPIAYCMADAVRPPKGWRRVP